MKLYIKNMVCYRCKMVVKSEFEKIGLPLVSIELGEVELASELTNEKKMQVSTLLKSIGFELIDNRKSRIIERIKNVIIDVVHRQSNQLNTNLSVYLADQILMDYNYLSNLFSEVEGVSIEHYYIAQKIERVKELLLYNELTLSEIAFQLNYSSLGHLSRQFKSVTGLTPSYFKTLKKAKRLPLDEV
jgi:AraC-like DNA-binding protein